MGSRLVAVGTELLDLQPFGGVPAILLGCVAGHTGRALGGIGPAFGALESDHDPDALVLGHKGRCAAVAKRSDKQQAYRSDCPPPLSTPGGGAS
ncbi:MAG: hypothetical protein RLZZ216_1530 [Cyanobacteriota bacterium]